MTFTLMDLVAAAALGGAAGAVLTAVTFFALEAAKGATGGVKGESPPSGRRVIPPRGGSGTAPPGLPPLTFVTLPRGTKLAPADLRSRGELFPGDR